MNLPIKTKYIHLFFLSLLSLHYVVPLIFLGQVALFPHDNLDSGVPLDHIIGEVYKGNFESINYLLGGQIKWFYLEELFYPINVLHLFLSDKYFYFTDEILKKLFAYFSFYLLAISLQNNKFNSSIGAILYTSIINIYMPHGVAQCFFPYILYLLVNKDYLNKKHYIVLFLIGLNSSLIQDFLSLILIMPLSLIFIKKKNFLKLYLQVFGIIFISSILVSAHIVIGTIISESTHREAWMAGSQISFPIIDIFKNLFFYTSISNPLFLFSFPLTVFTISILFLSTFVKDKNNKFLIIFIFSVLIIKSLLHHSIIDNFLIGFLEIFRGYNFQRLDRIIPLAFSLLSIAVISKLKYKNLVVSLNILLFFSVISLQLKTPLPVISENFLKKNMYSESFNHSKQLFLKKNYIQLCMTILNRNNYKENKVSNSRYFNKTFDLYYKFDNYSFIKKYIKNSRVMSVGLDPMIAIMNNIKVIDGYHNVYPLSYKIKFRKIIEKELEKNSVLRDYYDAWGNRVYAFYSNKNQLLLDFEAAKKIGADYIISQFQIQSSKLETICSECNGSNELFLYKIL